MSRDLQEMQENLKDVINSLIEFKVNDNATDSEIVVKLLDEEAKAIRYMIRNNDRVDFKITNFSSCSLLKAALDFFLTYSKYILFKVRDNKINEFTDHRFISASLMMGMWSSMRESNDF